MTFSRNWIRPKWREALGPWRITSRREKQEEKGGDNRTDFTSSRIFLFMEEMGESFLYSSVLSNASRTQNASKWYIYKIKQVFVHLPRNSTITVFLKEKCIPTSKEPTLKCIFGMQSV